MPAMMRNPRTEIVSVRLTKGERDRLDAMGGPSVLRRALDPPSVAVNVPAHGAGCGTNNSAVVWFDGTVGTTWPAVETRS